MNYIDNIKVLLNEIRSVTEKYSESKIEFRNTSKLVSMSQCNKESSLGFHSDFGRLMTLFPLFFNCLDSFIDEENPNLVGRNFKKKYDNMRVDSESDKAIKSIYRVLIMIRNISSHDINSCIFNNKIDINYTFNGTSFCLDMSEKGLRLIYGMILSLINENQFCSFNIIKYKDGVYSYYCNMIMNEINVLEDDKVPVRLEQMQCINFSRDVLEDAEFKLVENELKFEYKLNDSHMVNFCIEYENANYIIPQENLDNEGKFSAFELTQWRL